MVITFAIDGPHCHSSAEKHSRKQPTNNVAFTAISGQCAILKLGPAARIKHFKHPQSGLTHQNGEVPEGVETERRDTFNRQGPAHSLDKGVLIDDAASRPIHAGAQAPIHKLAALQQWNCQCIHLQGA
jgi:hypothetical protein